MSSDSTTKLTSDKNMFGGGRRRSPQVCARQERCQKTPTMTLLVEVLTPSPAWGFFSLETMFFEQLFEVLALTFRSNCKTGGRCEFAPSWPVGRPCMCLQWRSYETGVEKATKSCGGYPRSRHVFRELEVRCLPPRHFQVLALERSTMKKM